MPPSLKLGKQINMEQPDRVFIANLHPDKDFSPAEKFGELVYLTQSYVDLRNIDKLESQLNLYLKQARGSDFIILTGPSVLNALIVAILFNRFGYVNVLSWDGSKREYIHNVVRIKFTPPLSVEA